MFFIINSKIQTNGRFSMTVYEDFDENNISAFVPDFLFKFIVLKSAVYNIFDF